MSFNPQNYQFATGEHREKNVIFVRFSYNQLWVKELREKCPTAKWSASKKCWYLPDIPAIRKEIGLTPKTEPGKAIVSQIRPVNQDALKRMHESLLLKAYSPKTVQTYCVECAQLLYLLKDKDVDTLTPEQFVLIFCTA